jgi:6-phosphogluconolactonase (cycloisomerase 2 family)
MQMKRLAIVLGVLVGASVLIAGAIAAARPFATASARGPRPPIRLKGPARTSTSQVATFRWSRADTRTSGFRCRLDRGRFTRCKSGTTYKQLRPGTHTFTLIAFDAAGHQSAAAKGNTKPSPPSWSWTVAKAPSSPVDIPPSPSSPSNPGPAPVVKGNQTIAFGKPADKSFGEGSTTLTAGASSGLSVSFNSKTTSVCTVSGPSGEKVTFLATGTCTIEATQSGNASWNAAPPVEQSFTIAKGNQTITFSAPTEKRLDQGSVTLAASATSSLTVSFESKTTSVCTTSGSDGETVTFVTAGTCTIKATQAGDSNWNAAPGVEQSFTIGKGNQTITFTKPADKGFAEGSTTLTATASSGLPVGFESKTTSVCTTSGIAGETVTFLTTGTCTIKATQTGDSNWNAAPGVEQSFTIGKGNQTITFNAPAEKRLDQSPITVTATATSGLTVSFESKTTSVCTTSGSGGETVMFVTAGTCTIKATQAGDSSWNAAPGVEQSFTIAKGNQTITFTKPPDKSFGEGSTTLTASASSSLQVSFSSKTTSVCTVSGPNGEKVNFLATGTCTIEATQAGNANWNGATPIEQSFTIAKGNQTITFTAPTEKRLDQSPITVEATATSGLTVSFESKTTSVCTTSGAHGETVILLSPGTCTIEAAQAGNANWNVAPPVERSFTVAKGNQTITFTKPANKSFSEGTATVEATASSGLPVGFESKTTSVCATSGIAGETVTFLTTGTCTIKATQTGNSNWNAATPIEQSFTIAKGTQTITFNKPADKSFSEGTTTVEATATSGLAVSFSSKTTGVCTTSGPSGEKVSFVAAGTCTIEATQAGDSDWGAAAPVTQSFTIAKSNQTITFTAPTEKRLDQTPVTVTATASSSLAVSFESKTISACTTSGVNGETITLHTTGTCTIKANQTGNANWNAAPPVERSFTIAKGNQTITFEGLPASKRLDEGPLTLKAKASSGLPVTFESQTTSVCTTSGSSGEKVNFIAAGTCTIKANQTGNSEWNPAAEEQSFTITKGNQTITFGEPTGKSFNEGSTTLAATASSGLTVSFESKTTGVCTTSGASGENVSFVAAGTCTIKANQTGNANWNAATPVEQSFTITKGNQTITFNKPPDASFSEGTTTVEATASSGLPVSFNSKTTGVCTIVSETVTFHAAGTCRIEATQAGNTNWNAAPAVERSFTIAKSNQTITFNAPAEKRLDQSPITVTATATSGLTVSFESKTTGVCTTSGVTGATVTLHTTGTCTIAASQAGDSNWNAATPVEQSFTITKGNQTITFEGLPASKRLDEGPLTLKAKASSGLPVTFESKTTSTCTTSGSSGEKVNFIAAGTCTIKANQTGNSEWNPAAEEQSFTITKGNQTITFTKPPSASFNEGSTTVEASASSGLTVTFESKTPGICTTSGTSGEKVNFVAAGTCTIKANQTGNANWNAATPVEQSFTITKGNQTIAFAELPGKSFSEGSTTLAATASSGLTVTFESKTASVCTVSGANGEKVNFVAAGTCTIKATQAGNTEWNAATPVEQSFTITKGNQTIAFNAPAEKRLDQSPITVTATATSGLTVSFNSKTTGVCTIVSETVTFHAAGTCTIEATQAGNSNWNVAPPVEQSFTVAKGNQTIAFSAPTEKRLDQGPITVEATATSGLTVSFESKTTSVCTTSGTLGETVTFHTKGTCTIKANQVGDSNWNAAPAVERSFTIAKGNQTIAFEGLPASRRLDEGPLTLKAKASSGLPVTFESKTTSVCTTSGTSGETVTFHTTGTCTIKANQVGNSEWNATSEEQGFTITKGNQTITFGEPTGKSFNEGSTTLAATASSGLTVTFESKTASVCTVSGANGEKVNFVAAGTCTIKATQAGNTEWNAATPVEQSFTIAKSNQTITFTAPTEKRLDQGPITVEATATSGLPVSFESKTTSVCTTSGALGEKVSFVAAGTCTIKATQAGNTNWNAATAVERSFTVAKGNQTITFTAPAEKRLDQSPITVTATATSGLTVSFNSKTASVCTIVGETITLHAAGTCTIEATQAGSANWNAATPVSQSFTVAKGNQTITFNELPGKSFSEGSTTIAATASSGLAVTFESKTTPVCTVSGPSGEKVTFVTTGTCTIKATQAGSANWNAATPVEQSFAITSTATTLTALSPPTVAAGEGTSRVVVSPDGKNVYATNRGGGGETISQYSRNAETGKLTALVPATVATGEEPEDIVVSPDGANVYVANRGSDTISRYSRNGTTGALTVQTTIATGEGPIGLAITPDGKQVYAANAISATVSQYSRNTGTGELKALAKATVAAGTNAHGIDVSPDGKSVYVANYGEDTISAYARNEASGELTGLGTVAGGSNPHDLDISPDGASVYVADSTDPGEVLEMSRNTETGVLTAQTTIVAGKFTECIVVSPDGTSVYATNEVTNNVSQYSRNTETGELTALTPAAIAAGTAPEGIDVSPDSKNVYVANHESGSVSQYSR